MRWRRLRKGEGGNKGEKVFEGWGTVGGAGDEQDMALQALSKQNRVTNVEEEEGEGVEARRKKWKGVTNWTGSVDEKTQQKTFKFVNNPNREVKFGRPPRLVASDKTDSFVICVYIRTILPEYTVEYWYRSYYPNRRFSRQSLCIFDIKNELRQTEVNIHKFCNYKLYS